MERESSSSSLSEATTLLQVLDETIEYGIFELLPPLRQLGRLSIDSALLGFLPDGGSCCFRPTVVRPYAATRSQKTQERCKTVSFVNHS